MPRILNVFACVILSVAALGAADPPRTYVKAARVLDVRSGEMLTDRVIVIRGDKIEQIVPAAQANIPKDARVLDLGRATVLPGLIDAHVHLTSSKHHGYQSLNDSIPRQALYGAANARRTLEAGFTTVRNVGAAGYADVALREAINDGEIPGPRALVSGPALGITGGHCDNNLLPSEYDRRSQGIADGPWAVRAKVREVVKYGADVIKFCATGGVLSKGDSVGGQQYSFEEMQAIVTEAHELGRKVATHAHGTAGIKAAILAGVDSVEHSSLIDDEGIRLAKEHGTYLVMDTYTDTYILEQGARMGMLPESVEKERQIAELERENLAKAYKAGVKMAFGTDAGVYPHGDNAKQFAFYVRYGMTPMDAIRTATVNAADLLGWADRVGALEPGKFADLIAVEGNPLDDVTQLERVRFVMKGGEVFKNELGR
jgi:imidazolonepropionase-like amidohydrolase